MQGILDSTQSCRPAAAPKCEIVLGFNEFLQCEQELTAVLITVGFGTQAAG
jgi:hypothetical protein